MEIIKKQMFKIIVFIHQRFWTTFQPTSRAQATLRPKRERVFSAKIEFIRENRVEATENQQ